MLFLVIPLLDKMASPNSAFPTLLIFIFAGILTNFTIGSHNLHNFKKSSAFHKSCLEKYNGVWFGQELWLQEKQLSLLTELGVQYVARSGMEAAVSGGIMSGRPHGGVSIAWTQDLNHVITPLVNYRHKRLVCVELSAEPKPIILICLYMPFYDSANRTECLSETINTIAMVEEIMSDHPLHNFVLGGDFNTEFLGNSPFDELWRDCITKSNLICCDNMTNGDTDDKYTYIHDTLGQTKWNDHFFISPSLVDASSAHLILDDGANVSDHLPVMMILSCCLSQLPKDNLKTVHGKPASLVWDKCSEVQKGAYSSRLSELLINSPTVLQGCNSTHCESEICRLAIQAEYDSLTNLILEAEKVLPKHKPGVQKSWWTDELTVLRQKSIDIHRLWLSEGKPRSGATNFERLTVKAAYKRAIKNAQRSPKQSCWNRLHGAMCSKDTTQFWKSWKEIYNKNKSNLHPVVNGVTDKKAIVESFSAHFSKVSKPNNAAQVESLKNEFHSKHLEAVSLHECDCHTYSFSLQTVIDATFSLKKGKCCDDDKIRAEHFFNAPLPLFDRLQQLFNYMLHHSFVPSQFQLGTIIPLVKDRQGDLGDMNNYRGITIAPIISKIFEHVLRLQFMDHISTST